MLLPRASVRVGNTVYPLTPDSVSATATAFTFFGEKGYEVKYRD